MSDTTINLCENILLKSVKMVKPKFWCFKKSINFFHGVQNSFLFEEWYF